MLGAEANGATLDYPEQYLEGHFGAWPHGRADSLPFSAGAALDPQAGPDLLPTGAGGALGAEANGTTLD